MLVYAVRHVSGRRPSRRFLAHPGLRICPRTYPAASLSPRRPSEYFKVESGGSSRLSEPPAGRCAATARRGRRRGARATRPPGYLIAVEWLRLGGARFERLLGEGSQALREGSPALLPAVVWPFYRGRPLRASRYRQPPSMTVTNTRVTKSPAPTRTAAITLSRSACPTWYPSKRRPGPPHSCGRRRPSRAAG